MRLTSKFAAIVLIPIIALLASYYFSRQAIEQLAENQVEQQAKLVMKAANAARDYTSGEIGPLIKDLTKNVHPPEPGPVAGSVATQTPEGDRPSGAGTHGARKKFIKPTIPAYAARRILGSMFEKDPDFEGYLYKEAAKNPTLEKDKADEDESRWIDDFSNQLTKTTIKDFKIKDGREVWCFAQRMTSICHAWIATARSTT